MDHQADPERAPRRGCRCALFITEPDGTIPRSYAACAWHQQIARENRVDA